MANPTRTASFPTHHSLLGGSHVIPIQVGTDRGIEHVGGGRSQTSLLFSTGTSFDHSNGQVGLFAQPGCHDQASIPATNDHLVKRLAIERLWVVGDPNWSAGSPVDVPTFKRGGGAG